MAEEEGGEDGGLEMELEAGLEEEEGDGDGDGDGEEEEEDALPEGMAAPPVSDDF